ncbi:MAG TPA: VOC family protein [Polyangiaceae bacterium]|jgi:predicted enzyme related to lactoylglutathione lyase|nr:VOC family protein [Polyangiaceae bacterium]
MKNLTSAVVIALTGVSMFGCSKEDGAGNGGSPESGVANPYVRAGGIGVTDLEGASAFLTNVLSMTQEGPDVTRDDRVERTFWAKEADRGSRVVLMKFNDGRNTQDITAKIVFEAADVQTTYDAATAAGFTSILPPTALGSITVSQVKGPEGYTVEILNGLDPGGAGVTKPYFIALAFGITDFTAARKFYADAFGMKETTPYSDNDLEEQTMEYPTSGGAGLVLQHYQMTTHVYKNNPVKHVSYVPDVTAFVANIIAAGGTVVTAPAPMPAYGGRQGAVLADPDGYVIELVQE